MMGSPEVELEARVLRPERRSVLAPLGVRLTVCLPLFARGADSASWSQTGQFSAWPGEWLSDSSENGKQTLSGGRRRKNVHAELFGRLRMRLSSSRSGQARRKLSLVLRPRNPGATVLGAGWLLVSPRSVSIPGTDPVRPDLVVGQEEGRPIPPSRLKN